MDNRDIYNAICETDDKFLDEYEDNCKKIKKMTKNLKLIIPSTLCFIIITVVGVATANNGIFDKTPQTVPVETTAPMEITTIKDMPEITTAANNEISGKIPQTVPVETTVPTEITTVKDIPEKTKEKDIPVTTPIENKGGDSAEFNAHHHIGEDGCFYKIFNPAEDVFAPLDNMTLENRFCSFTFKNKNYYPAPDGDITGNDYESVKIGSVKASHSELRSPDEEVVGIEYVARIDIYKLKNAEPEEAVACVISFNGETKEYKYIGKDIIYPSFP